MRDEFGPDFRLWNWTDEACPYTGKPECHRPKRTHVHWLTAAYPHAFVRYYDETVEDAQRRDVLERQFAWLGLAKETTMGTAP